MAPETNTAILILNIDFPMIENKTQTQKTKHSVTGVFFFGHNLDLNTAGEKPSLSLFDDIFV